MSSNGLPNTFAKYARHLAYSESLALRHLHRSYGHLPVTAPLDIDMDGWQPWRIRETARKRRKKAA